MQKLINKFKGTTRPTSSLGDSDTPAGATVSSVAIEDEYGIKVLHDPKSPIVDIVFVHGLTGGQTTTWTAEGETSSWPEKFLSQDIPRARILAFGYDADVVKLLGQASQNNIGQHARNLLGDLADIRSDSCTKDLPIIFVAHSLGGLVCMNALVIANNAEQNQSQILDCTWAIAFLGTPHRGSDLASWATLAANLVNTARRANRAILDTLNPESEVLSILVNDFHPMLKSRERKKAGTISITCYAEELAVSRWGKSFIVVPRNSATLEQYPQKTIHSDHIGMTKFKERDSGYSRISRELKRWIEEMKSPPVSGRARLETLSTVPFARDTMFVGRVDVMADLEAIFLAPLPHHRVALIGLGGMGKSQIAIEFSYRLRAKSPSTWVFWVHASSYTRFEQGYRDIADRLKLPNRDDPKVDILQIVSQWLQDETNGPWLLILDNADDANMFTHIIDTTGGQPTQCKEGEAFRQSLLKHIPQTSKCSVLVTSRNSDAAARITGNNSMISVGLMSETESLGLLKAKLGYEILDGDSLELIQALGQIPLAITQAAAYISRPARRMSIAKYLELFRESETNQSSLLDKDEGDLRRDPDVPNAVISTWQISFNQIRRENRFAADLFSLMSALNRQGISESFLREDGDQLAIADALTVLCGFSLIIEESKGGYFDMHPLVQLATRKWLDARNEMIKWNQKALTMVSKAFPTGSFENWTDCIMLLPHAEAVLSYSLLDRDDLLNKASILHNISWYLWLKGDYWLSKFKIDQALEIRRDYLATKDSALLASMSLCAIVLRSQGRYEEAERMHRQTLELREKELGLEHPDTLASMSNLALVLGDQGRYEEAERMHRQALELSEKELGLEHPNTLTSMSNLALVLEGQGRYEEAERMHRQTLELSEKVLGLEHPETLTSMSNLALVLEGQGRYEEAERMYRQELELIEKVLGLEHPDTLTSVWYLASLLHSRRQYQNSNTLYQRACAGYQKILGLEHPYTLSCLKQHASLLEDIKRQN